MEIKKDKMWVVKFRWNIRREGNDELKKKLKSKELTRKRKKFEK